jgi:cell division protein FtsI/penicillin-binding protein 2
MGSGFFSVEDMERHASWMSLRAWGWLGVCLGATVILATQGLADESSPSEDTGPDTAALLRAVDLRATSLAEEELWASSAGGHRARLTLHPSLQEHVQSEFARFDVPEGAVVAIEPATGRVLAYVSHQRSGMDWRDVARDATPPAASVFKVITGAALVDEGVGPDTRVCYSGGFSRLTDADLQDNPRRDQRCGTLTEAMGGSINSIFAKLAVRHLDQDGLTRYASAFGFGHALPFDLRTQASRLEVPEERLEFARTAAGFWHMHLSPLHGALIAATIANAGQMMRPAVVEELISPEGVVIHERIPEVFRSVIGANTAGIVGRMMERTVTRGTARRAFFDPDGNAFLPGIRVAGKTGTLTGSQPHRGYSWWVGFAPADDPQIAVAALVINEPRWRIKASYMARETLRHYLLVSPPSSPDADADAATAP